MSEVRAGHWHPAAFVAAILVAILAGSIFLSRIGVDRGGVRFALPAREAAERPTLAARGDGRVSIVLPPEAPPGRYTIEVRQPDGSLLANVPGPIEAGKDGIVHAKLELTVPAGSYVLRLVPTQEGAAAIDYPFEVVDR